MNERNWQPIETAPQGGRMFIAFAITDTDTGNWHMAIVSHNHYREVGMGESQWTGWPRYSAEPTHWMPLPQPPAELSGNTGEFKCATCRDTKQVPFVYGQEYDCVMSTTVPCPDCSAAQPASDETTGCADDAIEGEVVGAIDRYMKGTQPATEQPTTWLCLCRLPLPRHGAETDDGYIRCVNCKRVWTKDGKPATEQPRIWRVRNAQGILYGTGTCDEAEARKWAAELALQTLAYSTDNGETWIDEQAEREGK